MTDFSGKTRDVTFEVRVANILVGYVTGQTNQALVYTAIIQKVKS